MDRSDCNFQKKIIQPDKYNFFGILDNETNKDTGAGCIKPV